MDFLSESVSGWTVSEGPPAAMTHPAGTKTTAAFIEGRHGRLFATFHEPSSPPDSSVIVCQPMYAESARNRRRELALAAELCRAGLAVARFDYRGAGHSSGDASRITFSQMVEDTNLVVDTLLERSGARRVGFVGTRLGGLVALKACADRPDAAVALWEPPTDLDRYYNEVFRARMIGLIKQGKRTPTSKDMLGEFARDGFMDVLGSPLAYSLYESTKDLRLDNMLVEAGPRPTYIIQMSIKQEIRPALSTVLDRCAETGLTIDAATMPYDEAWWFGAAGHGPVVETKLTAMEAVPRTVQFMMAVGA